MISTELKSLTRQRLRLIWEMAQMGADLNDEDAVLVEALREHPEYYGVWDQVDELSDEEVIQDGVNPILHVTIHPTVENQLAAKDPPVVPETLERLPQTLQGSEDLEGLDSPPPPGHLRKDVALIAVPTSF